MCVCVGGGGGWGLEKVIFFTMNPNLKFFLGGGEGARVSDFLQRIQIKKKISGGGVSVEGARVSDFFYQESKFKIKKKF